MTKPAELAYWINERYEMKLRKDRNIQNRKHGFSDDPHMGLVRYCNVHREDDKVTKWLAKNWRPNHHAVWEIVLARMINYIPSLEEVLVAFRHMPDTQTQAARNQLRARRERGEKVFTSAYTISTCGQSMDKIDYVINVVCSVMIAEHGWVQKKTLAEAHYQLMQVDGMGSFLAGQVIADLKNTKGHLLQDAPDWWTWSAPGPGSLKGLEEYFGRKVTASVYRPFIELCWEEVKSLVDPQVPPIHMQDFQNCLCEFSKFERVKKGGHARNKYSPG